MLRPGALFAPVVTPTLAGGGDVTIGDFVGLVDDGYWLKRGFRNITNVDSVLRLLTRLWGPHNSGMLCPFI